MTTSTTPPYDVVVVGARPCRCRDRHAPRPGGSAGAGGRPRAGTAPTRSRPTRCCGAASCSSPGGACWTGSRPPARRPCVAASFHYGEDRIDVPIKPGPGFDALYAPRRTVLDPILVDAARAAGAEVRFGVTINARAPRHQRSRDRSRRA